MKQIPAKTRVAVEPRELPAPKAPWRDNWLETPPEMEYSLTMDDQGDVLQDINLTREEYVALKEHLATLRGQKPLKRTA
jgi:hypothetical protein